MLSLGGIEAEINRSKVKLRLPVAQERLSVRTWCISRVRIEYYYMGSLPPPVRQDSLHGCANMLNTIFRFLRSPILKTVERTNL